MNTCRSQDREDVHCNPAALPHSVTRTARRRPPFPRSSGAAEVVNPPESPTARRCVYDGENYLAMASPSGDQEVEQREEGEKWAQVCGRGSSHPSIYRRGVRPAPRGAPTSPLFM